MIGTVVGNYRIVSRLGAGAMGCVYLAEHALMGRRAAVKMIHAELAHDPETLERFVTEARSVNDIRHPNIVEVTDLGRVDDNYYLIMELLEGETLSDRLERVGVLSPMAAVHIVAQVAAALSAAHERGFVHRDLKPQNIFLNAHPDYPDYVKVLDFGITKLIGKPKLNQTQSGAILGTPYYMSPEQCMSDPNIDARSDIYALGVVLYELITGTVPFTADSLGALIMAHVHEDPLPPAELNPDVPIALSKVVLRALAKQPSQRFQTMRELRDTLLGRVDAQRAATAVVTPVRPAALDRAPVPAFQASQIVATPAPIQPPPIAPPKANIADPVLKKGDAATDVAQRAGAPAVHEAPSERIQGRAFDPPSRPIAKLEAKVEAPSRFIENGTIRTPTQAELEEERKQRVATKLARIVIERIQSNTLVLPTMPDVALKCIDQLEDTRHTSSQLASTLSRDPLLATQVLKVANSVVYGTSRVTTLEQAASRLGARQLRLLLIQLSVHRVFESKHKRIRAAFNGVWEHSLAVGVLAQALCARARAKVDEDSAYLAGLLHDAGKPMVGALLLEAEKNLSTRDLQFVEDDVWIGIVNDTHRDVGVAVAEAWRLPKDVVRAIALAGRYDSSNVHCVTNFVCLANALAKRMGHYVGEVDDKTLDATISQGKELFDLSESDFRVLGSELAERLGAEGSSRGSKRAAS